MHKKLIMACMAFAVFAAFIIAPAASASPVATDLQPLHETMAAVPVGASIVGKSTGTNKFTSSAFTVECTTGEVKGTLTANTGSLIKGEVPVGSASFTNGGGECSSGAGATVVTVTSKLCLETITGTDNVKVTGCGGNVNSA